jgi:flagella basal body P-ring formation protein FlgA
VRDGGAQLELDGLAEGSGAVGEMVLVLNPDSQRRFPARVQARGRVIVETAGVKP